MKKILGPVVWLNDNQDNYQWLLFLIDNDGKITIKKTLVTDRSTELNWETQDSISLEQTFFVFDPETNNRYLYVHQVSNAQQHILHRLPVKKMLDFMWSSVETFQMQGTQPWLVQHDRALEAKYVINTYKELEISDEKRGIIISKAIALREELTDLDHIKKLVDTKLNTVEIYHVMSVFEGDFNRLKIKSNDHRHYIDSLKAVLDNDIPIETEIYGDNAETYIDCLRSLLCPTVINQLFSPGFLQAKAIDGMTIADVQSFFVDLIKLKLTLLGVPESEIEIKHPIVPANVKIGELELNAKAVIRQGLSDEAYVQFQKLHEMLTGSKNLSDFSDEELIEFSEVIKVILAKNYKEPYHEWQVIMEDYSQVRAVNSLTYDEDIERELKVLQQNIEEQLELRLEVQLLFNLIQNGRKQEAVIRFKEMTKGCTQLVSFFNKMFIENRVSLFKMLPEDCILSIIKNNNDINALLRVVKYQDYKSVLEKLGEKFKSMVQNVDDFKGVSHSLQKKNILVEAIVDIHGLEYLKSIGARNYSFFCELFNREDSEEEKYRLFKKLNGEYFRSMDLSLVQLLHLSFILRDEDIKLLPAMLGEEFIKKMIPEKFHYMLILVEDFFDSDSLEVNSRAITSRAIIVEKLLGILAKVDIEKFNNWFSTSRSISLALSKIPEKNHNSFLALCTINIKNESESKEERETVFFGLDLDNRPDSPVSISHDSTDSSDSEEEEYVFGRVTEPALLFATSSGNNRIPFWLNQRRIVSPASIIASEAEEEIEIASSSSDSEEEEHVFRATEPALMLGSSLPNQHITPPMGYVANSGPEFSEDDAHSLFENDAYFDQYEEDRQETVNEYAEEAAEIESESEEEITIANDPSTFNYQGMEIESGEQFAEVFEDEKDTQTQTVETVSKDEIVEEAVAVRPSQVSSVNEKSKDWKEFEKLWRSNENLSFRERVGMLFKHYERQSPLTLFGSNLVSKTSTIFGIKSNIRQHSELANRIVFLCNGLEQAKSGKSDRECAAAISNFFTMKEEVAEEIKKANPNGRIKTMIDFVKSECDKETGNSCSHKQVKNSSN